MKELSVNHLLGIKYLVKEDIDLIFETADHFKEVINRPIKKVPSLRDVTIVNLFYENSTRTRISFELAEKRLSADTINFTASGSSAAKGETLLDTVNNILSMKVDMVVMRHPAPGACVYLSSRIPANIINAGDGTHEHPTQALLDAFSLREKFGDLQGKKIAIIGLPIGPTSGGRSESTAGSNTEPLISPKSTYFAGVSAVFHRGTVRKHP